MIMRMRIKLSIACSFTPSLSFDVEHDVQEMYLLVHEFLHVLLYNV